MREPLAETSTEMKWMDGIDGEWRKKQRERWHTKTVRLVHAHSHIRQIRPSVTEERRSMRHTPARQQVPVRRSRHRAQG